MCGIKLKDFAGVAGIIPAIKTYAPSLFIFEMDTDVLTQMLILGWGNKTMYEPMVNADPTISSLMCLEAYAEKWVQLPTIHKQISIGADNTKTKKEVIEQTGKNDVENKVAAFNSDQLITDGANSGTSNKEVIRTLTDSSFSLNAVFNNLTILEKSSIINTVLHDIANFYCVSIYQ